MSLKTLQDEFLKEFTEESKNQPMRVIEIRRKINLSIIKKFVDVILELDINNSKYSTIIKLLLKQDEYNTEVLLLLKSMLRKYPEVYRKLGRSILKKTLVITGALKFNMLNHDEFLKHLNIIDDIGVDIIFRHKNRKNILISFCIFIDKFSSIIKRVYDDLKRYQITYQISFAYVFSYFKKIHHVYKLFGTSGIYDMYYTVNNMVKERIEFPILKMNIILLLYKFRDPEAIKKSGIKQPAIFDYNVFRFLRKMVTTELNFENEKVSFY